MIDKIKKLLALASDPSASPTEAETAARQAAKLMARHELDEYDVMMAQGGEAWDLIEGDARGCRPGKKDAKDVPPWINIISYGVKRWCNVRCALRYGGVVIFKGRRSDVELAQWMHNALVDACYSASKGRVNPNAWRNGYAAAIQAKFGAMIKDRDQEGGPLAGEVGCTSLVIIRSRLEQAMNDRWGEPGKGVTLKRATSAVGYVAGQGAHIPTNRPVSGASQRRLT